MYYKIIYDCEVSLWGVSQQERLTKELAKIGIIEELADTNQSFTGSVLIIRADYLFDANVLGKLIKRNDALLMNSRRDRVVAAWIHAEHIEVALKNLQSDDVVNESPDLSFNIYSPQDLTGGYDPRLRKFNLSHVVQVNRDDQTRIENYLYDKSYKGITDLVTKWFWPLPARWARTPMCRVRDKTKSSHWDLVGC